MRITAVIPTYNRAGYLAESLESVLGQTRAPDQVIVLDDGSTDKTSSVARSFGRSVEYIHQNNGGKSAALNRALQASTGDAIWVMDDDDVATPDGLANMEAELSRSDDVGFVFGQCDKFIVNAEGQKEFTAMERPHDMSDLFYQALLNLYAFQPAMLVRKRCYDLAGAFDTTLPRAQDYDMLLRLTACCKGSFLDAVVFHQRQHTGMRGPVNMRISGHEVWEKQGAFDAQVIRKALRQFPMVTFAAPGDKNTLDQAPELIKTLLRRASIYALRLNSSDEAASEIRAAAQIAQGHSSPLDSSVVPNEVWNVSLEEIDSLIDAASEFPIGRARSILLVALLWQRLRRAAAGWKRLDPKPTIAVAHRVRRSGAFRALPLAIGHRWKSRTRLQA